MTLYDLSQHNHGFEFTVVEKVLGFMLFLISTVNLWSDDLD
jgi:hypothetical protein